MKTLQFVGTLISLMCIFFGIPGGEELLASSIGGTDSSLTTLLGPALAAMFAATSFREKLPLWLQSFLDGLAFNVGVAANARDLDIKNVEAEVTYHQRY